MGVNTLGYLVKYVVTIAMDHMITDQQDAVG